MKILRGKSSFLRSLLLIVLCIPAMFLLDVCSNKKSEQPKTAPAAPVTVEAAGRKTMPVQLRAIGNVEAYASVQIKSRVAGELTKVHFREGQDVNKGDLLFTIDPRPFKAALESAQANQARDTALAKKADEDVKRYTELMKEELVSRDRYEQVIANAEAMKATVNADKAAVENARLQLNYCTIYAPISGRTGSLLVNEGNQIKANDDKPMVVIYQMQPVYVAFSVPEQNLSEIKKFMSRGKLGVEAYISGEDKSPVQGVLTFIDNAVDTSTGTIMMKATFDNRERTLWPGQFVTVRITLATIHDAVVVPAQAVQTGQQGQFVFVVKGDAAELRTVTTGITHKEMTVIEKGLAPGEQVITDGQMRLAPGAKVEIKQPQGAESKEQGTEKKQKEQPTPRGIAGDKAK